ncbi:MULTISPECIES: hypothetical protein [unclassified Colwellia]|jgi:hypothetical protein|uniref:hypothetical protein n=1 Tax=unclassified Colwellia TaxID=196834 RepID=UPI0015F4C85F|nr:MULTISPECIES: hypothetical protein [unclassified Colwellia]MBA6364128.1 hypothetical protein [Colwellia sp. BRX8-8]MBA6337529.1 hypothetical protein [Colwellia sp. BRX8-7]MBA6348057.1 hypothetical protein [Colwellia sp. BRX8-9]MBA6352928.1 hypothetical protein [Colwellia sp. BRX9-1]MBA6356209.1 hypothetical protein [Colwellia sp. BRX8-3]
MRIKLTQDLVCGNDTFLTGEEYEAVLILPRSTTVEFIADSGKKVRAFNYEYTTVASATEI